MKKIAVLIALLGLAACETVQGAGRDMQSAGRAIQSEAAEAQANL